MTTTTQPAELPAPSDEQIDEMVDAWFSVADENAHDFRARMRAALAATGAQAQGSATETREYKHAMGDWLGAVGELIEAMGSPEFAADTPVAVIAEAIREAAKRLAAQAAPAVPEINYKDLIAACYARTGQAQGTRGCIGFAKGAEWFREQVLAAAPTPAAQAPDDLVQITGVTIDGVDYVMGVAPFRVGNRAHKPTKEQQG